ncbi:MAG: hypothetical protein HY749_16025 [Gammaproteobacteria bacterium]|nr:hypothetical protein [Gammaproteobacteria bacterium]
MSANLAHWVLVLMLREPAQNYFTPQVAGLHWPTADTCDAAGRQYMAMQLVRDYHCVPMEHDLGTLLSI